MGSRVLLTGAAGFIGSALARLLTPQGYSITAIVNAGTDEWRIAGLRAQMDVVAADLSDQAAIEAIVQKARPDVCVHLAWQGGAQRGDVRNLSSLAFSVTLMRQLAVAGCRRLVVAGTCFEYAGAEGPLPESAPLGPRDLYGTCKKALFEVGEMISASTAMSIAHVRVFYAYGPFEAPGRLVASIMRSLLSLEPAAVSPGIQVRDFLHVDDIASAIWAVATSGVVGAVNIASGHAVSVAAVAQRIGVLSGRPDLVRLGALPPRDDEPHYIVGDPRLLSREALWQPRFSLETGLADTWDWWQANGKA